MLDPQLDAPARDGLAQDARSQIEASGSLKHENSWGLRKMAYEINKRTEADYRWLRFEAPTELLDELTHNLKIADGVLRFRIFKVDVDAPVMVPPAVAAPAPAASRDRGDRGPQGPPRPAVSAEPDDESAESAPEPTESAPESADVPVAADE
jgi:small subunit ribosomal protein S6